MPCVSTEYGKLKKVLLSTPEYLTIQDPLNVISEDHLNRNNDVNIEKACKEHEDFISVFKSYDVEVVLGKTNPHCVYTLNTRDLGVTTKKGIIFGRYVKPARWGEHRLAEEALYEKNIPISYKLNEGTFEGGDFMYLDENTAAVGIGIRTNMLGVEGLRFNLYDIDLEMIPVDFDEKFLHLDMICNVVGEKVAIICKEALPEKFIRILEKKKFELINVSVEEVFSHACNVLSIGNEVIISHNGAEKVNGKLKALGFKLEIVDLTEVRKSGGGPRCMSFPLERE
jgi:N-dimethylarginine dimethylaminohydrolase